MIKIQTSYFAKAAKLPNAVSVALNSRFYCKHSQYLVLAPTREMLSRGYDEKEYREQILSKLDPHKVAADLSGKILCCWEKDPTYCHRRIIARWLEETLKITVDEL